MSMNFFRMAEINPTKPAALAGDHRGSGENAHRARFVEDGTGSATAISGQVVPLLCTRHD
jgi:hypothetical protein